MPRSFSIEAFDSTLRACLPAEFGGRLCVALSGGLDSTVLLHALTELARTRSNLTVRAVHIDHQLQSASADWAKHCERVAGRLGVPIKVEQVRVDRAGDGLEAAARRARYAVFRRELGEGEALVTAHHGDDQVETLLIALMRGSGVPGLAAMPARKRFARGWHVRPLLAFTRAELAGWASEHEIEAVEDPSNLVQHHDRNYLRAAVLPMLRSRWPAMAHNVGRTTRHLAEALALLGEIGSSDLGAIAVDRCLDIARLLELEPARRRNALRQWLRSQGCLAPSTQRLLALERDLQNAAKDRAPAVIWRDVELHWHGGLLYAERLRADFAPNAVELEWERSGALELPAGLGALRLVPTSGPGLSAQRLPKRLQVRFRHGGEKIRLPGHKHRRTLRNLYQENAVLPWWRDRIPLLFVDARLIAVGNLAHAAEFAAERGEAALRVEWDGAPQWRAVENKVSSI